MPVDNGVPLVEVARFMAGVKGSKHLAWEADGSRVVFVSRDKGLRELDALTGDVREVSSDPLDEQPEPGRDENSFAYLNKGTLIFVIDGHEERVHSQGVGWSISEVGWNPDGTLLRYVATGSGGSKVYVFDPRSGSQQSLYSAKSGNMLALRCPAKSHQFFTLREIDEQGKKSSSVVILSDDDSGKELFQLPRAVSAIQVSPDGMNVYYVMNRAIYCFERSTGLHRLVAERAGDLLEISPCGNWLMTNPAGLAICPSHGGRLKQIISAPGITEFIWSIRGQIAVLSNMNGHSEIWLFRVDDEVLSG